MKFSEISVSSKVSVRKDNDSDNRSMEYCRKLDNRTGGPAYLESVSDPVLPKAARH